MSLLVLDTFLDFLDYSSDNEKVGVAIIIYARCTSHYSRLTFSIHTGRDNRDTTH